MYNAFKVGFIQNDKVILNLRKQFDHFDKNLLRQIITEGKEKKVFNIADIELTIKNIQLALRGMEIDFVKHKFNEDCQKQLNIFIDMISSGILKKS